MKKPIKISPREVRLQPTSVDSADGTEGSPSVVSGQGVREGYQNIKTQKEVDGLVKATLKDFKADMTYEIAKPIGTINTGTPEAPVLEQAFQLVKKTAPSETLAAAVDEYENYVRGGAAYNAQGGSVPPGTTVPGNTTIPPATTVPPGGTTTIPPATTVPPLVKPLEMINCRSGNNSSEHIVIEQSNGNIFILPNAYELYNPRLTIEFFSQFTLRQTYQPSGYAVFDIMQYDANDNVVAAIYGHIHGQYFNVNATAKKVLFIYKELKVACNVPGSIMNLFIGSKTPYGMGRSHEVSNDQGVIQFLYITRSDGITRMMVRSGGPVQLPYFVNFYRRGILVYSVEVGAIDWLSSYIPPTAMNWDYISITTTNIPIAPPAVDEFLYVSNKMVSATEFPRFNQIKVNGVNQMGLGFIEPGQTTGTRYIPPVGVADITIVAPGTGGLIRLIDSLEVVHEQPQGDGSTNQYVFTAIDISKGYKVFLLPPGTPVSPVTTKAIKIKSLSTSYTTMQTKSNPSLNLNNGDELENIYIESNGDYIRNVTGAGNLKKVTFLQADGVTLAPLESPNPHELIADVGYTGQVPESEHYYNADISLLATILIEDVAAPTTIPPPPPEITTTVPEVTTTVPETTVPPTTVVAATASNGNGDELKELDRLVEKELEKKKTSTKKK